MHLHSRPTPLRMVTLLGTVGDTTMTRRTLRLLVILALGLLVAPLAAEAQPPEKVPRIGYLHGVGERLSCSAPLFLRALRELGYVEGQNIRIAWRCAELNDEWARQFARELVQLRVDVIVANTRLAALATKAATTTIPIVFIIGGDPVPELVPSRARPGGNLTGVTNITSDAFFAKHLELLMAVVPGLTRVALLLAAADVYNTVRITPVERAAQAMG